MIWSGVAPPAERTASISGADLESLGATLSFTTSRQRIPLNPDFLPRLSRIVGRSSGLARAPAFPTISSACWPVIPSCGHTGNFDFCRGAPACAPWGQGGHIGPPLQDRGVFYFYAGKLVLAVGAGAVRFTASAASSGQVPPHNCNDQGTRRKIRGRSILPGSRTWSAPRCS